MVVVPKRRRHLNRRSHGTALVSISCCALLFTAGLAYLFSSIATPSKVPTMTAATNGRGPAIATIPKHDIEVLEDRYLKVDIDECLDYGCPIYPPELTDELREVLSDESKRKAAEPSFTFGTERVAMITQTGLDHIQNQDRAVAFDPFLISLAKMGLNGDGSGPSEASLVGLFDGHGTEGHYVANYVNLELPEKLAKKLDAYAEKIEVSTTPSRQIDEAIKLILRETFVDVDIEAPPNALFGGCTATVTLRIGSKLYVANAGDSRTVVADAGGAIAYATRKDKGNLPDEYDRIVNKYRGNVHVPPPPKDPNNSRVVAYCRSQRDQIGLAMSRSIGDWEFKAIGVIAEPIVDVVEVGKDDKMFVIAASDGIWDCRKKEFFAKQFADAFYGAKPVSALLRLFEVFERVTPKNPNWYRDDMTAVVIKI